MYSKPAVIDLGTLRELTRIGFDQDCDGGIFGIGVTDGSWLKCERTS